MANDVAAMRLLVAAGAGWVGNFHCNAPAGLLAAVRYLVEKLGAKNNHNCLSC